MKRFAAVLPIAAVAAWIAAVLVWLGTDRRLDREAFEPFSTANTSPSGLSQAYRYLRERGAARPGGEPEVGRLTAPLEVVGVPPRAVLFRIEPADRRGFLNMGDGSRDHPPSGSGRDGPRRRRPRPEAEDLLTPGERTWVEGGGRLVLALGGSYGSLTAVAADGPVRKVFPAWPGVQAIDPAPARALSGWPMRVAHAVFLAGEGVIACRWPLRAGEVILLGCPEVFQNERLGEADHLALLEALAGDGRPVLFDEFAHGMRHDAAFLELARRWGFGPFVVLAALAAGAALWRASARLGPPEEDYEERRREAVDFVDSVARLYRRALRRWQALDQYRLGLVRTAAAQTGLRGRALDERLRDLTGGLRIPNPTRGDVSRVQFDLMLKTLNDAYRRLEHDDHRRSR